MFKKSFKIGVRSLAFSRAYWLLWEFFLAILGLTTLMCRCCLDRNIRHYHDMGRFARFDFRFRASDELWLAHCQFQSIRLNSRCAAISNWIGAVNNAPVPLLARFPNLLRARYEALFFFSICPTLASSVGRLIVKIALTLKSSVACLILCLVLTQ